MLRPVIFIGCGGSGEKAVRYVRAAVQRTLDHYDWHHGMPNSWQFIGLDTLTTQESPTEIPTIPSQDFLTLSSEHDTYAALHRSLVADHSGHLGTPELLCGWLPDPDGVRVPLKDGAGQNRAIGRAAGLRSLERTLLSRLKEAFRRAKSGGQELYEVGQKMGVDAELGGETPAPIVVVCSSMAGGTGAGIALDVVDLVRRCDPLGAHPSLVLFANDIFEVGESQPMAANSLGLLSELLAAYWSNAGEIESPLSTKGVQSPGVGPHSVFLLGRVGYSGADLGNTMDFYHAVGEAMSAWVTSSVVQEEIHNFINVNWRNDAKRNFGGYPFGRDAQFGAVSSFGAAKITVGRDRFAHWAQHALGREVLEGLLNGHLRDTFMQGQRDAKDLTDEQIVARDGEAYATMIYDATPLWSQSPERLPGLAGAVSWFASDDELRRQSRAFTNEMKQELPAQGATGEQWGSTIKRIALRKVASIEKSHLSSEDRRWCIEMVDSTCKTASQVAAMSSLSVAVVALKNAAEKLNREHLHEIRQQAAYANGEYQKLAAEGLDRISKESGHVGQDDDTLSDAITSIAQGLARRWQSHRLDQAATILEHAEKEVLNIISDSLRAVIPQVAEALDSDEVRAWPAPRSQGIPLRYTPSTVEFPLESHHQWVENLERLSAEAFLENDPVGERNIDHLRYHLVSGTQLMEAEEQIWPLVHLAQKRWMPGQAASVICKASSEDIESRVHQWTFAPGGKFKRFLDEGLAAYLSESDRDTGARRLDHTQRLQEFRTQLGKAKEGSKPLIAIDQDLYGECHPSKKLELLTVCSQFPFAEGHVAHGDAKAIIGDASFQVSTTDTTSILVSQFIKNPVHPMVVRSITVPLNEAVASTEDPEERSSSFWMWRRARRLDGFVPLPRTVLESVVRGFAVARLCGYITAHHNETMRISAAADEVEFPWPWLSRLSTPDDILAGLLEAFSLTFGLVGGEGIRVFEGYSRLHQLGEPVAQQQIPTDLEQIITTGSPPYPVIVGQQPKVQGSSVSERQQQAMAYLKANEAWFLGQKTKRAEAICHRGSNGRAERGVPTMEMAELFTKCYSQLHNLLETEIGHSTSSVV